MLAFCQVDAGILVRSMLAFWSGLCWQFTRFALAIVFALYDIISDDICRLYK